MPEVLRLLLLGSPPARQLDRLMAAYDVTRAETQDAFEAALQDGAGISAIAMFGHWVISPAVLDALPDLKVISNFGVGYDTIDAAEAARRGIIVSHTPEVLNAEVADTTLMLWLAVSRQLLPSERWARSGEWERKGAYPLTRSIRNRTVGILGMGRIGQEIAATLRPFNPTILYHTRSPKDVPYEYVGNLVEMARRSDVLIVITPGGAGTRHLINADVMNALGPDGILINVARGGVVDEEAVVQRLLGRAEIEGRSDDNEETIRNRMKVYRESTEPLVDYYRERGLLAEADGMGTIEEVAKRIEEALGG